MASHTNGRNYKVIRVYGVNDDTEKPVISDIKVTAHTSNGYTIQCRASDNAGVAKVEFPTWKASVTSEGCKWYQGSRNGDVWTFTFTDGNTEGDYITHIYATDTAGNLSKGYSGGVIYVNKTKPVITDVKVTNITSEGFDVSCKVTDNNSIDRVEFPTWTSANGQDDLKWHRGVKNGDTYSYHVSRSEHNNEFGEYIVHIYAWDKCGNNVCVDGGVHKITDYVPVEKVVISYCAFLGRNAFTFDQGYSTNLGESITPGNATNKKVTWSSSDPSVVSVDAIGTIKALKAGTATITVKTEDGGKTASCTITVKAKPSQNTGRFKDVSKNAYYYNAVEWTASKGITTGSNGKFYPTTKCKRCEIITFIYRYKN